MRLEVNNKHRKYVYFDKESLQLHENIWDRLTLDRIRQTKLCAHDLNSSLAIDRPDTYKEVIPGIVPIPPRSRWFYDGGNFVSCNNSCSLEDRNADLDKLLKTCRRLLAVVRKVPIGIDLSGGLDTSIIIGLFEHCKMKPFLAGFNISRYEFRTESMIQQIHTTRFETSLLDIEESLPFSHLKETPVHQLPTPTSLSHSMANQLAIAHKERGTKIIFNGMGIDALLCDDPLQDGDQRHPESWFPWMMDNNWLNEYVFSPYGIKYKPAAASKLLIHMIWQMRKDNREEDLKKMWARHFFSPYLPTELVNYTYKADYVGLYVDGLWNAGNEISEIFEVTYDLTKYEEFSQSSLNKLMSNLELTDDAQDKLIRSRISFANWIFGLVRDKFI